MKQLKEYGNLNKLYRRCMRKMKIPFFICLLIFILSFATFFFRDFPFEVTLAMMGMIFPVMLFGLLWLISSIRTKTQLKYFSLHQLFRINEEAASCEVYNGMLVTSQAVIRARFGLQFVPMSNVLWVYITVTTGRLEGLIPIYKETMLVFAGRDHKKREFRIKNDQKAYDLVQTELLKYRQDIVFGYEDRLDDIYRDDLKRMIAYSLECEENRKKEMEVPVS